MTFFKEPDKTIIFSEQKWRDTNRSQKIKILKSLEKEITTDLQIKSIPRLIFSKEKNMAGTYKSYRNTLTLSELMALEGKRFLVRPSEEKQTLAKGLFVTNHNSNIDTLFTICHELEHAAQYQRVCGKIEWRAEDDQDGITVNQQQKTEKQMFSYIKGDCDATNAYELYQLQPAEYGANQSALKEINNLVVKYQNHCSENDIEEFRSKIIKTEKRIKISVAAMTENYRTDNIVRDISFCLQNLFLGKQHPVPPDLMRDIEDACHKSYELVHSQRYQQLEMRLKREINRQLAEQEYER